MTLTKRNRKLNVEDVCNYVRPPRIELIEDFYKKESGQRQYHHGTTMYLYAEKSDVEIQSHFKPNRSLRLKVGSFTCSDFGFTEENFEEFYSKVMTEL